MENKTKKKILRELAEKREYQVIYKFSDVIETIEAHSKEEAQEIANNLLGNPKNTLKNETYCYEIEVEED